MNARTSPTPTWPSTATLRRRNTTPRTASTNGSASTRACARPTTSTVYDPETNPTGFDYSAVDTDWQDEVFRDGMIQNYHLSIDGGGEKFTYSMSGSWFQAGRHYHGLGLQPFHRAPSTPATRSRPGSRWARTSPSLVGGQETPTRAATTARAPAPTSYRPPSPWLPGTPRTIPKARKPQGKDMSGRFRPVRTSRNVTNPFQHDRVQQPPRCATSAGWATYSPKSLPIKHLTFRSSFLRLPHNHRQELHGCLRALHLRPPQEKLPLVEHVARLLL